MKKLEFRLLKKNGYWYLQKKNFWGIWKTFGRWCGSFAGSVYIYESYKSKKEALENVSKLTKLKKSEVCFVQYPTMKEF